MTSAGTYKDDGFGLQIAPMLDILFVLLLFFMVAAGSLKHEASLATRLPGTGVPPGGEVPVHVTIDADGQVNINGGPVDGPSAASDLPETITRLKAIVANYPAQPVFLTPMPGTRQQRVVDVMDACTAAGVTNLALGR